MAVYITERAELIPRSFVRGILNSMWGAVREEDGDLLSEAENLGGQGVLEPPHFLIRGVEPPQNWRLSMCQ